MWRSPLRQMRPLLLFCAAERGATPRSARSSTRVVAVLALRALRPSRAGVENVRKLGRAGDGDGRGPLSERVQSDLELNSQFRSRLARRNPKEFPRARMARELPIQ